MSLLQVVQTHFERQAVPHALIGAAPLAAAGVARSPFDVDVLVMDRRSLERGWLVYPGSDQYALGGGVTVVPAARLLEDRRLLCRALSGTAPH